MAMEYYAIINSQRVGPMLKTELRHLHITPETPVWHEGLADWQPASSIPSLSDILSTSNPTPQSPSNPYSIVGNEASSLSDDTDKSAVNNSNLAFGYTNQVGRAITALVTCAILTGILGAWPAILGLVNSIKARRFYSDADYQQAINYSKIASRWIAAAWALTGFILLAIIVLFVIFPHQMLALMERLSGLDRF